MLCRMLEEEREEQQILEVQARHFAQSRRRRIEKARKRKREFLDGCMVYSVSIEEAA